MGWITSLSPPPWNSGPCNSFYCLGHFKNVYDDDDDEWTDSVSWLQKARKPGTPQPPQPHLVNDDGLETLTQLL